MEKSQIETNIEPETSKIKMLLALCVCVLVVLYVLYTAITVLNSPSSQFPIAKEITIAEGLSQDEILTLLESKNAVRSSYYAHFIFVLKHENEFMQAGSYLFKTPLSTKEVLKALISGAYITPLHKLTFPEGFQTKNIEQYFQKEITNEMKKEVKAYEGYLFPDTYHVSTHSSFSEVIALMQETFNDRISKYDIQIAESDFTKEEVITLASLIEREANDVESKKIISGILQHRLEIEMPLQVDATFDYLLNKTSAELTQDDLEISSPYNTYTRIGLPPRPIANTGIESIEAVLKPTKTSYLYYLTGNDGTFHYAKTFEEHKQNKNLYLQ